MKGDDIKMPDFTTDLPLTDKNIDTLEMAYFMGWALAILACGEIAATAEQTLKKGTN